MTDWEGNITLKRQRKIHTLDLNLIVDKSTYEDAVDNATISVFQVLSFIDNTAKFLPHESCEFTKSMSMRAEHSKFLIGIGSIS